MDCLFLVLFIYPGDNELKHNPRMTSLTIFYSSLNKSISKNPLSIIVSGDCNARSTKWWRNDMTTTKVTKIDWLSICYGFSQIYSNATHIIPNLSLFLDLILTNESNVVIESGVQASLIPNHHNHIPFVILSLKFK